MAVTALEDFERACDSIKELNFTAENRDEAIEAFEAFRKAVTRVMRSADSSERDVLAKLEPKTQLTEFLLDLLARHSIYRSRVAEAVRVLQKSDSWAAAVQADVQQSVAIQRLLNGDNVVDKAPRAKHLRQDNVEKAYTKSPLPHLLPGASMGGSRRIVSDPWSASSEKSQVWGAPQNVPTEPPTFRSSLSGACRDNTSNPFKMNAVNNRPPQRVANWNAYVVAN